MAKPRWRDEDEAEETRVMDNDRPPAARLRGTIIKIDKERGFGFVKDERGQERFFHRSACDPAYDFEGWELGDVLTFEPFEHPKGSRAMVVREAQLAD